MGILKNFLKSLTDFEEKLSEDRCRYTFKNIKNRAQVARLDFEKFTIEKRFVRPPETHSLVCARITNCLQKPRLKRSNIVVRHLLGLPRCKNL